MCTSQLAFLQVVTACQIETRPMFAATLDLMRWDCDSACTAFCTTACLTAVVCPPDREGCAFVGSAMGAELQTPGGDGAPVLGGGGARAKPAAGASAHATSLRPLSHPEQHSHE